MIIDASEKEQLLQVMGEMQDRRIRRIFMTAAVLLVLVTLSVTGFLNHATLMQNQNHSLLSGYAMRAAETARMLSAGSVGSLSASDDRSREILQTLIRDNPLITWVQLLSADGLRLGEPIRGEGQLAPVTEVLLTKDFAAEPSMGPVYEAILHNKDYYLYVPIRNGLGAWVGTLELEVQGLSLDSTSGSYTSQLVLVLGGFAAASCVVLLLLLSRVSIVSSTGTLRTKRLLTVLLITLALVQGLFGFYSYWTQKESLVHALGATIGEAVRQYPSDTSLASPDHDSLERYLERISYWLPEVERVVLVHRDSLEAASDYDLRIPLPMEQAGAEDEAVLVRLSRDVIAERLRDIVLDTATLLIISFVLMVEISLLITMYLKKKVLPIRGENLGRYDELDRSLVRPLSFLVFAAVNISISFIPALMKERYEPILGLSEAVVIGLPISAEMLSLGLVSTLAGDIIDRKGWKPPFLMGACLIGTGLLLSAWSEDALAFILARAIVGAGFGFTLMAMQAYTVKAPTEDSKNEALTQLNSGAYAGMNFGIVVGGIMADRLGFTEVFVMAFVLILCSLLFAWYLMGNSAHHHIQEHLDEVLESMGITLSEEDKPSRTRSVIRFLSQREIWMMFALILIPISICGMFVGYFFPVYAESIGVTPSDIGRVFLLNGLCIVFLGPLLSDWAEKKLGVRTSFSLSNLLVVCALLLFAAYSNLWTAIAAVVLFGIAEGVGITAQINYYISRRATGELGEGKAMGLYSLMENMGQMMGPIAFGSAAAFGIGFGVGSIGFAMLVLLGLFMLGTRRDVSREKSAEAGLPGGR